MYRLCSTTLSSRPFLKASYRHYSNWPPRVINITDIPAPHNGRIRILSLNRPSARNAISSKLLNELRDHLDSISAEYDCNGSEVPPLVHYGGAAGVDEKGPTRALVIASEVDSCFCAGADLKERSGFTPDETNAFLSNLRETFTVLSTLPIPTISAVSSVALGGGLELALCTNMRVFASTAIVGLPETRLGIIPGAGGTYRLPALIGLSRARDLILTGRRVSAAEAYFLGITDRLVEIPEEDKATEGLKGNEDMLKRAGQAVKVEAIELAKEICMGGPVAIRAAIEAVAWAREDVENNCYKKVLRTTDRDEALAAFREKRRPKFTGK